MKYTLKMTVRAQVNETFNIKESSYDDLTEIRDNLVRLYHDSIKYECLFKFGYIEHTEEGNRHYMSCYSPEFLKISRIDFVIIEDMNPNNSGEWHICQQLPQP